jgi:hypothetical protein
VLFIDIEFVVGESIETRFVHLYECLPFFRFHVVEVSKDNSKWEGILDMCAHIRGFIIPKVPTSPGYEWRGVLASQLPEGGSVLIFCAQQVVMREKHILDVYLQVIGLGEGHEAHCVVLVVGDVSKQGKGVEEAYDSHDNGGTCSEG